MKQAAWWQREATIAWAILFFFPVGLFLMWRYAPWRNRFKWTWSFVVPVVALIAVSGAIAEEPPVHEPALGAAVTETVSSESPPTPLPTEGDAATPIPTGASPVATPVGSPASELPPVVAASPVNSAPPTQTVAPPTQLPTSQPGTQGVLVTRVIDGDTIEIQGGKRVRYIGIDTPESTSVQECFGTEATNRNRQLVEGKVVTLEKDVSETDRYDRLLRYVYVGGVMVNETLVREGFAQASTYPPDVKYQDVFLTAQRQAREANRGFWGGCIAAPTAPTAVPAPSQPVAAACPQGCTVAPAGCVIKGNISYNTGEKIYHVPGGGSYGPTVINPSVGERWFCTEQEAIANGWRKARN